SAAVSGLSELNSAFKSTTTAVAGMWTEAGATITVALKNASTAAENASGRTKEQIERASGAADKLGELIGVRVPGDITKLLAASETIGPMLEAAFTPLKIVAAVQFVIELADKIKTVAENLGGWTKEARENYAALVQQNNAIIDFNERLGDSARRLNEIGHSGSALKNIQIGNDKARLQELGADLNKYTLEAKNLHKELEGTHTEYIQDFKSGGTKIPFQVPNTANMDSGQIEAAKKRLGELEGDAEHAKGKLREITEEVKQLETVGIPGKEADLAHAQVEEAISAGEARVAAEREVANKRVALAQSVSQNELLVGKRTAQQAAADETKAVDDKYANEVRYLNRLRAVLSQDQEHNKDRLAVINAQLQAAELDHQKTIVDQYSHALEQKKQLEKEFTRTFDDENRKRTEKEAENNAREVEEAFRKIHKMAEDMKAAQGIMQESDRKHDEALKALAESRLAFELQIGKISETEYEKRLAAELAADYKKARDKLLLERESAAGNIVEQRRVDAALLQLDDKYKAETEKAEQKSYLRRTKNIDAFFSHVKSAMDQSISGFLKGTESFAKAWQNMWSDMVVSMVQKLAEMMLKWIEHHVAMLVIHTTEKEGEVAADASAATQSKAISLADAIAKIHHAAASAASRVYDAEAPLGPVIAGLLAAGTYTAVLGFGAMASAEGGQYYVPNNQLTMLHPQEMVLPAGIANQMRGVIEGGGGGGVTVVVNHSVSAVDAASFQGHIRRHSNMIANEVTRALKRKGVR
ncbi:MAG TPA: hypothetical protein VLA83_02615, partial [Candidatus Binatia bacterium]|nr:hypothetical protein [Candidatus Binatia bacterium]